MPVCRKETSVEVSRCSEEFLLCAGLWEFIARYLKVLYKVSSVLMPRPSRIFQGQGFPFVLLYFTLPFCLLCMGCQRKLLGGAMAALAPSLSDVHQPAWRPGLCLVRLKSMPKLTRCRLFPGHLAGPGRHHLGTHTLYDAHTFFWCGTTTHHVTQTAGSRSPGPRCTPSCSSPQGDLAQPGQMNS